MEKIKTLDIGEVVERSGLAASTLRFYEEKGLIRPTGRHGLRRLFNSTVLEQLEFIALGRKAGFSLDDITTMLMADGRLQIDRELLMTKAKELDASIKQLIAVRNSLSHVANCRAPIHTECPKFQRLLRLAGKAQTKSRVQRKSK